MEQEQLVFYEQPTLYQPDMVIAFAGWSDAAQAATGAIAHLVKMLNARKFAEISGDEFFDFSNLRPMITVEKGLISSLALPHSSLFYWQDKETSHDLILLHGIEPQLHWTKFVDLIADLAERMNISKVYTLGGLYDRIPHTREPKVSGVANDSSLIEILERHGIAAINYEGPSSLHGLLLSHLAQRKKQGFGLWGHAPFYVRVESNPMVCFELLKKLTELLGIQIDLEEIEKAGMYLREMLSRFLAGSSELQDYIQKLEAQYDMEGTAPPEPSADTDRIIKEVEEFLRTERNKGESP